MAECKNCRFWVPDTKQNPEWASSGECHRFPPLSSGSIDRPAFATFPVTFRNAWCGEYQRKPETIAPAGEKQQASAEDVR